MPPENYQSPTKRNKIRRVKKKKEGKKRSCRDALQLSSDRYTVYGGEGVLLFK